MNNANIDAWLKSYRRVFVDFVSAQNRKAAALERIAAAMEAQAER